MTPIPFRNTAVASTAIAVKATAGKLFGVNLVNSNATAIYVKLYDKAAAGVAPASDKPTYTFLVPGASEWVLRGLDEPFDFQTAISVRSVTGVADTDTTAPAVSPIIELDFY